MRKLIFIMALIVASCTTENEADCNCIETSYSASRTMGWTVCHNGTTLTFDNQEAYDAHILHGDTDGECTLSDKNLSSSESFYSNNCNDDGKILRNKNNSVTGVVKCQ